MMDAQTLAGTAALTEQAVQQVDAGALRQLTDWAAGQRSGSDQLAPVLPTGALPGLDAARSLVDQVSARRAALSTALACPGGPSTAGTDQLGPLPPAPPGRGAVDRRSGTRHLRGPRPGADRARRPAAVGRHGRPRPGRARHAGRHLRRRSPGPGPLGRRPLDRCAADPRRAHRPRPGPPVAARRPGDVRRPGRLGAAPRVRRAGVRTAVDHRRLLTRSRTVGRRR